MRTPVYSALWIPAAGDQRPVAVHWRDLNYGEHRRFSQSRTPPRALFCDVYETCLVAGPPLAQATAGIVAWIARQQLEQNPFSGLFAPLHNALYRARERVRSDWFCSARAVLASTFRCSFDEIASWSPELFFERVAQAELLTGVPVEPADPRQEQAKAKAPGPGRNLRQMPSRAPQTEAEHYRFHRGVPPR